VTGQRTGDPQVLMALLAHPTGPTVIIITLSRLDGFHGLMQTPGALPPGDLHTQLGPDGKVAFYAYTLSV
jgi:hypothetical protein